ncbi:MAG: choice-of-anchor D domain-containing protein, partial [Acidobacteriaceae bacterium]
MARASRCFSFAPNSSSFRFVFTSLSIAGMILAGLTASAAAWAQASYTGTAAAQNFGSQAVGSTSAAATLTFSIAAGTTVGSIAVVTTGIPNLDFTNSGGGTCATQNYTLPATCTVDVKFKPEFAGPRKGAVVFFSEAKNSGTVLGQVLIYGTGTAPQIGYSPSPTTSFTLGCCYGLFLSNVRGMTVDAAGNQFIASTDGNYVVKLPADGGTSAASAISPVANGKGLSQPSGVAIDGAGDLLIADSSNNRVVILPPGGGAAIALDPAVDGKGLSYPMGLSVNGAGDLFIADAANGRVVEQPAGGGAAVVISPVAAGKGLNTWVPDVAVDAAGDLFILDESNLRVVEVPAGGGTPLAISPTANGTGLSNPYGIAVDAAGNLFITDNPNVRVVEVPAGGAPAFVVNLDGSTLYNPVGMAVDGPGNLYIVDNSHVRILELQRSLSLQLNFPTVTGVATIDTTDGTQTVQVQNLGNNALTLSGVNYPADFPEVNGDANACTSSTGLSAGQRCDLPVEFAPTESGPLSEQIVLTDNALNVTGTQQAIAVSGTGYADVEGATHFSVTPTSLTSVVAGTPFSIVVTALNFAGSTATTYNGTVSFTSSDPGFVNPGPLTLSDGIGQVPVTLPTAGTQTISATDTTTASVTGTGTFYIVPAPRISLSGSAATQNLGSQMVGSATAPDTLTFSIAAGTTVGSIAVVTTGIENLDFTNAGGGTCAAQDYASATTCTARVTFKPMFAGPRKGAVVFYSEAGNTGTILGQALIYGTGTGPQTGYSPSPATVVSGGPIYVSNARAMTVDAAGNQFIASAGGNYVIEFPAVGGVDAAIGISPVANGEGLNAPSGVAVDGAGDLFIADSGNNRVVEVPAGGGAATVIDPTVDGTGLSYPWGIAVDAAGDLFIADKNNSRVVEVPAGGGAPVAISPVANGKGLSAAGSGVIDLALDTAGDLFILDSGNNRVVEVPAGGGTPLAIVPRVNGAGLDWAQGIAVDVAGNLFVSNVNSNLVMEVPAGGGAAIGLDPTAGGESLWRPVGMAVDGPGNLYIVDNSHTRVVELQRSIAPTVSFPTQTAVGSTDTTDGTQTVQVQNLGNEALTLSGLNYPADFSEGTGDTNVCTGSKSLSPGKVCNVPVEFAPQDAGALSEAVTLIDNALNVTGAQQPIPVSGTAVSNAATHFSVTSTASVVWNMPFSITVTALNLVGTTATTYDGTVSFTSSDPRFVNPGPLTLSNGTGQTTVTLRTGGPQTITATDTTTSTLTGSGSFNVAPPVVPPTGYSGNVNFGSQRVGTTSKAQAVSFSIPAGTTVSSIAVLTQGVSGLDFASAAGSTCTAQEYTTATICTVNVTFAPRFAGTSYGAVDLYGDLGSAITTAYLQGAGVAPQITFGPYPSVSTVPVTGGVGEAPVAVDESGDLYVNNNVGVVKETLSGGSYIESTV